MRAIWKGAISFGLVTIPIALLPATRKEEEIRFRLLRKKDRSPVQYKRVAEADGKEVPWEEITKGYEYAEGKYVVLSDDDFAKVDLKSTRTVEITDFVALEEVDPIFFSKPYFMEPGKGGEKAYLLLRDALQESGKIGIAKVVIRTREYLAAVKPDERGLMLELMHFANELVDASELKAPEGRAPSGKEMAMAKALIEGMSGPWEPEKYRNDYHDALKALIEKKIASGGKIIAMPKTTPVEKAANVVDLVSMLQESLARTQAAQKKKPRKTAPKTVAKSLPKKRKAS